MTRRLALPCVLALCFLVPAVASAEESCSPDLAALLAAEAAAPEAAAASLDDFLTGAPEAFQAVGCDKTWCSERRFECKDDCLPCGFSFTCYALSCAYSCWCVC
ncbi:MAG TPA: hypothetical protein VF017_07040 [Thermoanaerobaculia bacterium]|nr:hypothetical protein [Thermoanaerobaculia bacterium]